VTHLPPPPSPQNDPYYRQPQQQQQGVTIPGLGTFDWTQIAKAYTQYRPIIGIAAKFARQKVPKELDDVMAALAFNPQEQNPSSYEGQPQPRGYPQPPEGYEEQENVIGQPVMTRQTAMAAWIMHHKEHMSLRDIEIELAKEGNPASRSTIARWINDVDEEMHFSQVARLKTVGKWAIAIGAWVFTVFLTHILF
jgi:hypothetical protein